MTTPEYAPGAATVGSTWTSTVAVPPAGTVTWSAGRLTPGGPSPVPSCDVRASASVTSVLPRFVYVSGVLVGARLECGHAK